MSLYLESPDLLPHGGEKEQIAYLRDYLYKAASTINEMCGNGENILEAIGTMDASQLASLRNALGVYSKTEDDEITVKADSIISVGKQTISGIEWNYRKWKSGYIELWASAELTFPAASTALTDTGMYRSVVTLDMSSIASSLYVCEACNISYGITTGNVNASTSTSAEIALFSSLAITSRTIPVKIFLIGKW